MSPEVNAQSRLIASFKCVTYAAVTVRIVDGPPGRIRTLDPRLRRPLLYPTELLAVGAHPTSRQVTALLFTDHPKLSHPPIESRSADIQQLCSLGAIATCGFKGSQYLVTLITLVTCIVNDVIPV